MFTVPPFIIPLICSRGAFLAWNGLESETQAGGGGGPAEDSRMRQPEHAASAQKRFKSEDQHPRLNMGCLVLTGHPRNFRNQARRAEQPVVSPTSQPVPLGAEEPAPRPNKCE